MGALFWHVVHMLLEVVIYLILGRAIMSWFIRPGDMLYPFYMGIVRITEPILSPFRNLTSRFMRNSGIDFSPLFAILAIYFLERLLYGLIF